MIARALGAIDRYVMAPAPAARLAGLRILGGGYALVYLLVRSSHFLGHASFPRAQFSPVGVVSLACSRPLPAWAVTALLACSIALAIAFVLGYRMRASGPLFALSLLWVLSYGNSFGMIFHTENLLCLHIAVLGLSQSADAWSLDARRRGRQALDRADVSHGRYGWPIKLMCVIVVIAYALAGVAKLRYSGAGWMFGDELRNHVAIDNARKLLLGDIHSPLAAPLMDQDFMWRSLAILTVVLELGAPLALVSTRLGTVWVIGVLGFHAGVLALMMIAFPYQLSGVAFACLFPVERPLGRIRARFLGRRAPRISS